MPITKEDLSKDWDPEHLEELKNRLNRCMSNDRWANNIFKRVAILIVSYPGQRAYLKYCIESHLKLGYLMALAYDNYINPKESVINHNDFMPDKVILDNIDIFFMPHYQTWCDVDYPYFWQLRWGAYILQQFEYIYVTNGDCILDNPDGFNELLLFISDGDFLTCGDENRTVAFIVKSKAFLKIVQYMQDHYVPFDSYEKYPDMNGAEGRMYAAIDHYNLKRTYISIETWSNLVGMKHIHQDLHMAHRMRLIPPHYKYLEEKYLFDVYNYKLIKKYWDTGDIRVLDDWWCE